MKNFKILLAEDNEANQLLLQRLLTMAGHDVAIVSDGEKALNALTRNSYDLCIFDMQMPVMSGIEAIKNYKEKHPESDLPFIILTADTTAEVIIECEMVGVNMCLNKSIEYTNLKNAVNKICLNDSSKTDTANNQIINIEQYNFFEDPVFLEQFIEKFDLSANELMQSLNNSLENDFDEFKRTIHSIKGLTGYLSANILRDLTSEAEKLSKESYTELSNEYYSKISSELSKVQEKLFMFANPTST